MDLSQTCDMTRLAAIALMIWASLGAAGSAQAQSHIVGSGNGVFEEPGLVLFVSGVTTYLSQEPAASQESAQQRGATDHCACLRKPEACHQAGEQRRFPLYLEFLAGLLVCAVVSWGSVLWVDRG